MKLQVILVALIMFIFFGLMGKHVNSENKQSVQQVGYEYLTGIFEKEHDTLYIVNFWATWCSPCVKEMPYFEEVAKIFRQDAVKVVLVSLDMPNHTESRVIPFIEEHDIRSYVVHLTEGKENEWIPQVDPGWTGTIPATLFINPRQNVRAFHAGVFTYDELKEKTESLLH